MSAFHVHDCDCCTYLGSEADSKVDYYFHDQRTPGGGFPMFTLIARLSSEPPDYISGAGFYLMEYHINTAGNLALEAKLITLEELQCHNPTLIHPTVIFKKTVKPVYH